MKIVLTGGGTGGHFYPIIAVAEALREVEQEEKLLHPDLYYYAPEPYDRRALFENDIEYVDIPAGKWRLYASIKNFTDLFKTIGGIGRAFVKLFNLYPDIIFAKGGYASFPTLFAARILQIPVIIHESDAVPGKVNAWAGRFAVRIATSYPEAVESFPEEKAAHTGQPIREGLLRPTEEGAYEFLNLDPEIPVIFVLGGSQGAQKINDTLLEILFELVEDYQVIHQTGPDHLEEMKKLSAIELKDTGHEHRYKPFGFLNELAMRMAAGAADLVVSRAGSTIFEIAIWGTPSIVIPIGHSNGDHQRKNAFSYARTGAAEVIEERNLTDDILLAQIKKILTDPTKQKEMRAATEKFAKKDAAHKIAREIVNLAIKYGE